MLRPHQKDELRAAINTTRREMQELKQAFRPLFGSDDRVTRSRNAKTAIALRQKQAYIKQLQGQLNQPANIKKR